MLYLGLDAQLLTTDANLLHLLLYINFLTFAFPAVTESLVSFLTQNLSFSEKTTEHLVHTETIVGSYRSLLLEESMHSS